MGAVGDRWTWCECYANIRRFEATDLTVLSVNKQHGGYATGQLVTLNLFRKRV
jgi:hypothetical protein